MGSDAATTAGTAAEATASERAIERFLDSPSLSAATRRAYRVDALEFVAWLERRGLTVEDVDVRALTEYAADLGRDLLALVDRQVEDRDHHPFGGERPRGGLAEARGAAGDDGGYSVVEFHEPIFLCLQAGVLPQ